MKSIGKPSTSKVPLVVLHFPNKIYIQYHYLLILTKEKADDLIDFSLFELIVKTGSPCLSVRAGISGSSGSRLAKIRLP